MLESGTGFTCVQRRRGGGRVSGGDGGGVQCRGVGGGVLIKGISKRSRRTYKK